MVGVMQIDRLMRAVVGCAIDTPAAVEQAHQGGGQVAPLGVVDREVVQAGGAGRWRKRRI